MIKDFGPSVAAFFAGIIAGLVFGALLTVDANLARVRRALECAKNGTSADLCYYLVTGDKYEY